MKRTSNNSIISCCIYLLCSWFGFVSISFAATQEPSVRPPQATKIAGQNQSVVVHFQTSEKQPFQEQATEVEHWSDAFRELSDDLEKLSSELEEIRESSIADLKSDVDKLTDEDALFGEWDGRFQWESNNDAFRLSIGARVEKDFAIFDPDPSIEQTFGAIENGTEFRRARIVSSASFMKTSDISLNTTSQRAEFDSLRFICRYPIYPNWEIFELVNLKNHWA